MYVIHKLGTGFYNKETCVYERIGNELGTEINHTNYLFKEKPEIYEHMKDTVRAIKIDADEFRYILDDMEEIRSRAETRLESGRGYLDILLGKSL